MGLKTAVYVRISHDSRGEGLGVARQEQLCRDLCAQKGWEVAEVYVDNDVSAYSGKPRPAYARMLDDLQHGLRDAVVVVDTDRLVRSLRDLEDFIDLAERHGVALANVSGDLDLGSSDGRFRARIMGAVARQESEKKSERQKRERAQAAQAGKAHGGPRPFGFRPDRVSHEPTEAALVREAVQRVLAGESLRAICRDWAARGVTAPQSGGAMSPSSLRALLRNPRIAGLRAHRGEVVAAAEWEPIIDRECWERLVATLRSARSPNKRGRPATNLLSGIVRCGRCGAGLSVGRRPDGKRRYGCTAEPGRHGCGGVTVAAEPVEAYVSEMVLSALDGDALRQHLGAGQERTEARKATETLADIEARREDLATAWAEGAISRREWQAARAKLEARAAEATTVLDRAARGNVLAGVTDIRAQWEAADIDWRRAVLKAVIEKLSVNRAAKPARAFDPARVEVLWRA